MQDGQRIQSVLLGGFTSLFITLRKGEGNLLQIPRVGLRKFDLEPTEVRFEQGGL